MPCLNWHSSQNSLTAVNACIMTPISDKMGLWAWERVECNGATPNLPVHESVFFCQAGIEWNARLVIHCEQHETRETAQMNPTCKMCASAPRITERMEENFHSLQRYDRITGQSTA